MKKILFATVGALLLAGVPVICNAQVDPRWKIHDLTRPVPPAIDPGTPSTQDSPGRPPSDAVVLFDGKDLSKWNHKERSLPSNSTTASDGGRPGESCVLGVPGSIAGGTGLVRS